MLFILAMCLSIPTSFWPTATMWTVIDFIKICVFYFFIINIIDTENKLKGFLWLYIISTGYTAVSSALAYFSGNLMVAQGIERAEGLAGTDPNTLAVSLVLAVPFLIFAFGWIKNHWLGIVPVLCAACAIFTISLTGSRSGVVGLVAVMFFIWLTSNRKLALALVFLVVVVAGWFALPSQYKERYSTITSTDYDPSTQGRFDAWEAGLQMFVARPFFGVGAGTFAVAYSSGNFSDHGRWLKAHSMYIQIIAEIGIFGLIAFAWLVGYMIRQNFRLRKLLIKHFKRRHWLAYVSYAITCSIGALFITSLFGHSLFRTQWYWACALTVVMWRLADKYIRREEKEKGEGIEQRSGALSGRS
jgi:probable O-glycosylation ligase (exosortase A-associated)